MSRKDKILDLVVKGVWFDKIKSGKKTASSGKETATGNEGLEMTFIATKLKIPRILWSAQPPFKVCFTKWFVFAADMRKMRKQCCLTLNQSVLWTVFIPICI